MKSAAREGSPQYPPFGSEILLDNLPPLETPMSAPTPLPPGVEVYLVCLPRGWRGELHDGSLKLEARGATPEAVVAELVRLYHESGKDPLLA
jgi:hypothetical protein